MKIIENRDKCFIDECFKEIKSFLIDRPGRIEMKVLTKRKVLIKPKVLIKKEVLIKPKVLIKKEVLIKPKSFLEKYKKKEKRDFNTMKKVILKAMEIQLKEIKEKEEKEFKSLNSFSSEKEFKDFYQRGRILLGEGWLMTEQSFSEEYREFLRKLEEKEKKEGISNKKIILFNLGKKESLLYKVVEVYFYEEGKKEEKKGNKKNKRNKKLKKNKKKKGNKKNQGNYVT